MNRYSQLLKLASKLDEKGLVKEADSIEKLVKLAQGRHRGLISTYDPSLQRIDSIYPQQHPLTAYNIRGKAGEPLERIRGLQPARTSAEGEIYDRSRQSLFDKLWGPRPNLPQAGGAAGAAERATAGAAERATAGAVERATAGAVERTIAKPSTLRILGKLGLLGAGGFLAYKGGQWLGNQLRSDWGSQPQGPQPSGPQPIYPGAYTPPTGMYQNMTSPQRPPGVPAYAGWSPQNKKWSIHGDVFDYYWDEYGNKLKDPRQNFIPGTTSPQATSQYQCSYCGGSIRPNPGGDMSNRCAQCGAEHGGFVSYGPTVSPWKEQNEQQRQILREQFPRYNSNGPRPRAAAPLLPEEIEKRLQAIYDQQTPPPSYNPPEWGQMVPADKSYI